MKRLMNDFASQDLLLICRDYMPPGPPSALCGMFYIKSHCSNSSNQMNEAWILYTFPKSRIRSSTACEVVLCAVFLMSVLSYFTPLSLWAYVVIGGGVCMSFPCCKCDHSCLSQSQLRVCGTLMFCGRRGGLTAQAVSEMIMKNHHCKKCDWTHAAFHASEERQRLKMTKDRKERLKLNEGFPLLQEPSPLFSSPLSSLLLSSPPHPAAPVLWWIRCWAGWPDRKCSPPPSVCLCKRRSRERERGELFLTQAGCRRRKNERLC